jgi:teichuronic acid exporter
MKTEITKSKVLSSMIWKLMEYGGAQLIQAIVQIILARLLMPEEYGLVVLVVALILVANVFLETGLNMALIQKKDVDEVDFSSVFYLNILIAGILYSALFFMAPYIAGFYKEPQLVSIIRVLSLTLFIGAVNTCQGAFLSRNMMFKKLFLSSLGGTLVAGIVGIAAAYAGWGVWALVVNNVARQLLVTIIIWFTVKWRPQLIFSLERVKSLFSYGSKMMASGLIYTLYENAVSLIIVRAYSPSALGFYNRGSQFPKLIMMNINGSIQAVMLPTLSHYQEDRKRVKNMVRRSVMTSSFIVFPMMAGLAAVADPMVRILLTEKWLPAVPYLQIFCGCYALWPISTANSQAISALGRSDIFLKLEIINTVIGIIILTISIPRGTYAIAVGMLVGYLITTSIVVFPVYRLIGYGHREQLRDILPSLAIAIVMGVSVYSVTLLDLASWQKLIVQMILGIAVYIGLSKALKVESLGYLIDTVKQLKEKSKGG